jgi:hypothetical protein
MNRAFLARVIFRQGGPRLCGTENYSPVSCVNGGPRVMGNKWRSRRGVRSAQPPLRLTVAIFGFVVHAADFQLGKSHERGKVGDGSVVVSWLAVFSDCVAGCGPGCADPQRWPACGDPLRKKSPRRRAVLGRTADRRGPVEVPAAGRAIQRYLVNGVILATTDYLSISIRRNTKRLHGYYILWRERVGTTRGG